MTTELLDRQDWWAEVPTDGGLILHDEPPTLSQMQAVVDGDLQAIPRPPLPGCMVLVNEERTGRSDGQRLLLNTRASAWLLPSLWPGQTIVGNVVVHGAPDENGDPLPLTPDVVAVLNERFAA